MQNKIFNIKMAKILKKCGKVQILGRVETNPTFIHEEIKRT
jgi:hypothetical protein